jgi:hypothetical protein
MINRPGGATSRPAFVELTGEFHPSRRTIDPAVIPVDSPH